MPKKNSSNLSSSDLRLVASELREETERLRSLYPLKDLLKAKELEIDRIELCFNQVPKEHPEIQTIEKLYRSHLEEKEQLLFLIEESEKRFQNHLKKIHDFETLFKHETEFLESPEQAPEF